MDRKYLVAVLVMFVAWMIESMVVHGMLLHGDYAAAQQLFRPEAESQQYFHWMLLAHVLLAGAFVWIYRRGISAGQPWLGQGLRFGAAVALLTVVPTYLIYYAVQPMPGASVVKQIVFDAIGMVLLGGVVAWWHRDRAA